MATPIVTVLLFAALGVVLAGLIVLRPEVTRMRGGRILAFIALFVVPVLSGWMGFSEHLQRAESTRFCLSCHVMSEFGKSLYVDDASYIPARHFQNNLVPRDHACYSCHTDYTMFGTVHAKFRGLRHLFVYYFGKPPKPDQIKLYTPFNNRECLHCHLATRAFEEQPRHTQTPDMMVKITSNQKSCLTSKCHDTVHDVGSLGNVTFWKGGE